MEEAGEAEEGDDGSDLVEEDEGAYVGYWGVAEGCGVATEEAGDCSGRLVRDFASRGSALKLKWGAYGESLCAQSAIELSTARSKTPTD